MNDYDVLENEKCVCKYCGKTYSKKGIGTHIWRTHGQGKEWKKNNENRKAWNKGLKKENNEALKRASETYKKHLKEGLFTPSFKDKKHSLETKEKWKQNPRMGGLRKGSGLGIKGWYKGFYCRSTWELAWLFYQLDSGVQVDKCEQSFEYFYENKKHKYYPDFIVGDTFIEIKGYRDKKVQAKIDQFPENKKLLMIEGKKEIKPYVDYAIEKYGKNFWICLYNSGVGEVGIIAD